MGLTSALFTGLSGLNVNQSWMDVVGNNIANTNTVAFKASQVSFSPQFYTDDQPGSAPDANFGGTNPSQSGLGAQVAAITQDFTPGSISPTGVDTDMAINGTGFFVVNSDAGEQYTRDGSFSLNSSNQLVNNSGDYVQGYGADTNGNIIQGSLQNLTIPLGQTTEAKATQNAVMQGNLNAGGNVATGSTILTSQPMTTVGGTAPTAATNLVDLLSTAVPPAPVVNAGDVLTLAGTSGSRQLPSTTLTVTPTTTVSDLQNFINEGLGINTTVSEPGNPTPGTTLQTTGTTGQLTIIGNTGTENALTLGATGITDSNGADPFTMSNGSDGAFTSDPTGESTHTTVQAYDSLGNPVNIDLTTVLESKSDTGETWRFYASSVDNTGAAGPVIGSGTLNFNNDGVLQSSTGTTLTISRTGSGAGTPVVMNLNFSGVTSLASTTSNLVMGSQDGSPIGTLSAFSVGQDGTITGSFTNGLTKTLGQVAIANFNNPQGLVDEGKNIYQTGPSSGSAIVGVPGTVGGVIQAGALEQSNVDISKEFVNMIIASTGFSASSRVITTSNDMLTQLLNSQH
jgi:flagellar hook protein FlgE